MNQNLVVLDALIGNEWRHVTCRYSQAMRLLAKHRAIGDLRGWSMVQAHPYQASMKKSRSLSRTNCNYVEMLKYAS